MSARLFSLSEATQMLRSTRHAVANSMQTLTSEQKKGLFVIESRSWTLDNGIKRHYQATLVTIQGLAWLDQHLNSHKLREVS